MASPFVQSLLEADTPVIMEVKRRAADGTDLFAGRSLRQIVTAYEEAGAPCLSVVTGEWFGGVEEMLPAVVELSARPVLQKDFVTRRSQVARARDHGASAVLLTAALLPRSVLGSLVEQCLELGLTPFVELTTEAECAGVPYAEHCVVAVNNKDIRDRERGSAEVSRSTALLPQVLASGAPCVVSAGGIGSPSRGAQLIEAGYTALLVGTGLLRAASVQRWVGDLTRRLSTDRVPAATPPAGPPAPVRRGRPGSPSSNPHGD